MHEEDEKCIQNFGHKICREETVWKTAGMMRKKILKMDFVVAVCGLHWLGLGITGGML